MTVCMCYRGNNENREYLEYRENGKIWKIEEIRNLRYLENIRDTGKVEFFFQYLFLCHYDLFKTCSYIRYFHTCPWLVNVLFTIFSWLRSLDLLKTYSWLFMTCSELVHYFFLICSLFVHDLFLTWYCLVHDLFTSCSWFSHKLLMTCSLLAHAFFSNNYLLMNF